MRQPLFVVVLICYNIIMIVCTELDNDFDKYRDKVESRKVIFTIKRIF